MSLGDQETRHNCLSVFDNKDKVDRIDEHEPYAERGYHNL